MQSTPAFIFSQRPRQDQLDNMSCSPTRADCGVDVVRSDGMEGTDKQVGGGKKKDSHLHVYSSSVGRGKKLFACVRGTFPIINPVVSSTTLSDCSSYEHAKPRTHSHEPPALNANRLVGVQWGAYEHEGHMFGFCSVIMAAVRQRRDPTHLGHANCQTPDTLDEL